MRPVLALLVLGAVAFAHDWNGIARDRDGALYLIDGDSGRIFRVGAGGAVTLYLGADATEACNHPHHLAFDAQGALWIPSG